MKISPYSPAAKEASIRLARTDDEETVVFSLLNFLNAISLHFEGSLRWTPHRVRFKFESGGAAFQARTDGYLKDHRTGNVIGIVGVRAGLRSSEKSIRMQESAEMVAWITSLSHAPKDLPGRSVLPLFTLSEFILTAA
ncbi:hypothetical protein BDV30DRAFT_207286 [Aspergillus minisclerotigenes]|uniref:Uncharacterized protein n=1 Tax=Aspergillus minisclerotigenes TaxID=656917 RepID=A0A5N6JA64_9EURO|nr:hypothetical protein BDV30DRAFT_207286 [Aspergillus minisclerotigenes]